MSKRINVFLLLTFIVSMLALPAFAQDDAEGEGYDLDGDGVNINFPEVDPFDTNSYIRFAHLAPEVGDVDIYVNGELMDGMGAVAFETLGDWIAVEPGGYDIAITAAGDDMMNAVVNLDSFQLPRGQWLTAAAVIDDMGTPAIVTAVEDFSEPLPGVTNLTFFNALSTENDVDFFRDGVFFVANLGQMASDINSYSFAIPVDTQPTSFSANVEIDNEVIATSDEDVDLNEWSSYLIAVYGDADGNAQLLIDETSRAESAVLRDWLPEDGTVVDALAYNEALEPYVAAIDFAGLVDTLNTDGPFTIFIPAGYLADEILVVADGDVDLLGSILAAHVYEGEALYSQDLIELDSLVMINGNEIPVIVDENGIFVGGAQVIDVNIPATNGVIHVLGYVIDPSLDQDAYNLFDDAVNLENSADPDVVDDLEEDVDDMEDDEDMDDEDSEDSED